MHSISGIPVVFLSSEGRGVSVVVTVGVNKSSFVRGPFSLSVLLTGVDTLVHQGCACRRSRGVHFVRHNLGLGIAGSAVRFGKRDGRLDQGRFVLLRLVVQGVKGVISESSLVRTL